MAKYKFLLILVGIFLFLPIAHAQLSGWKYRVPIIIDNSMGPRDLSYYQVPIYLSNDYITYLASQDLIKADCSDIRFTDSDGVTLLNYWVRRCRYVAVNVSAYYGTGTTCISDMNNFTDTPNSYGNIDWYTNIWQPCSNCDYYARIYLNLSDTPESAKIEIVSDDGQVLWVNGVTVGGCGSGCHGAGTCSRVWDISGMIVKGSNEIRIWCTQGGGGNDCHFRLFINGVEIRKNGAYSVGGNSEIWVKVPNIQKYSKKTIYLYSGNPSATSLSNGNNVFEFFDDFSGDLSKWSLPSSNWFILNGELVFNGTGEERILTSYFSIGDFVLEYDEKWVRNNDTGVIFRAQDTNNFYFFRTAGVETNAWSLWKVTNNNWNKVAGGSMTSPKQNSWYKNKVLAYLSRISVYYNDVAFYTYTDSSPFYSGKIGFRVVNGEYHYDNVRVRRYVYPEPAVILGQGEIVGAPKITVNRPLNLYYYVSGDVDFSFFATDDDSPTFRLTAYLDGSVIYDNPYYTNGALVTFTRTLNDIKMYNLTIVAIDKNGLKTTQTVLFYTSYLPDWSYNTEIIIDNSGRPELRDYQIKIFVDTKALISKGLMGADCGDMRFLDSDRKQFLQYWIEYGCNSRMTHVWVRIPYIPANSIKKIYLYSGNPFVSSIANGSAVFDFFDDFNSNILDPNKWVVSDGSPGDSVTVSNGRLNIYEDGFPPQKTVQSKIPFTDNFIVEFKGRVSTSYNLGVGLVDYYKDDEYGLFLLINNNNYNIYSRVPGVFYYVGPVTAKQSTELEYFYKIVVIGNNITFYRDNLPLYDTVNYGMRNTKYIIFPRAWNELVGDSGSVSIDYIFVRKYVENPPEVTHLISLPQSQYTFLYVPNSGSMNSISEVDITYPWNVREVSRHWTVPSGWYGNPSRTAIDHYGNAWVGNRATNSLVKIGSLKQGTCVDRNGNGVIDTSRDSNGNGVIDSYEMVSYEEDECILKTVTVPYKAWSQVAKTGCGACHCSGGGAGIFDLTTNITVIDTYVMTFWCSEAYGEERCQFRFVITYPNGTVSYIESRGDYGDIEITYAGYNITPNYCQGDPNVIENMNFTQYDNWYSIDWWPPCDICDFYAKVIFKVKKIDWSSIRLEMSSDDSGFAWIYSNYTLKNTGDGNGIRAVCIDANDNVYAGVFGTKMLYYIDGKSGSVTKEIDLSSTGCQPYGCVVDKNGLVWVSCVVQNLLVKYDPKTGNIWSYPQGIPVYGITPTAAGDGVVFNGWDRNTLRKVAIDGYTVWSVGGPTNGRGVTVDLSDNIFAVGSTSTGQLIKYAKNGTQLKSTTGFCYTPTGVGLDYYNFTWVACYDDYRIVLFDSDLNILNAFTLGGPHYVYSDWTGYILGAIVSPITTTTTTIPITPPAPSVTAQPSGFLILIPLLLGSPLFFIAIFALAVAAKVESMVKAGGYAFVLTFLGIIFAFAVFSGIVPWWVFVILFVLIVGGIMYFKGK